MRLIFHLLALLSMSCTIGGAMVREPRYRDPIECGSAPAMCAGSTFVTCEAREVASRVECPEACDPALGCVSCRPGARACDGQISVMCRADGTGFDAARDCREWSSSCDEATGYCDDECSEAEALGSYVGCEYWAVPLANSGSQIAGFEFVAVAANASDMIANVRVYRGTELVSRTIVYPDEAVRIPLPWIEGVSTRSTEDVATSGGSSYAEAAAYRILSSSPITVTQYNPFEYFHADVYSFSNDSSLLFPQHALGTDYIGLGTQPLSNRVVFPQNAPGLPPNAVNTRNPGYLTIVATRPGETRVTIHPSAPVAADPGGRFPSAARGEPIELALAQGDVAHVAVEVPPCTPESPEYLSANFSDGVYDLCGDASLDLSGSRIHADREIAVFAGHYCAFVPWDSPACDHLETAIPPSSTLGREYVVTPLVEPGAIVPESMVRVVAVTDTHVTFDPPVRGESEWVLAAGESRSIFIDAPCLIEADAPVMVAELMLGQEYTLADRGDPSLTLVPPVAQYRTSYPFYAPTSYREETNGQSYLALSCARGALVELDGVLLTAEWSAVGDFDVATIAVEPGRHVLESDAPCGAISFGLGSYTSYADPAGLDLVPVPLF